MPTEDSSAKKLQAIVTFNRRGNPVSYSILADSDRDAAIVEHSVNLMFKPFRKCLYVPRWIREVFF